jgi:iron complex transport system substrate-binding protein
MDQDLVVMYGPQENIEGNRVVRRLDAVREDRVVYLDLTDKFAGALGFASALSLPWLLDPETDALAAAVDGDPATRVEQPR